MSDSKTHKTGPATSMGFETVADMPKERKARPSTVRDVAKEAGVSLATVSRVVNGVEVVSGKTRTKVLSAISSLRYYPNVHASELGRSNGGIARNRVVRVGALSGTKRAQTSHPKTDAQKEERAKTR